MQAGSSKSCLPDTRMQLLMAVMDWALNPNGARCFLLYGPAGMGKSAVAHSTTRMLADTGDIITPFFAFDRNDASRQAYQLYPTLAESLARYDAQYLGSLRALRTDQLKTIDIEDQYRNLTLSTYHFTPHAPIVFVIDALDECRNDDDKSIGERAALFRTLRACISDRQLPSGIRFLITMRSDDLIVESMLREDETIVTGRPIDRENDTERDIRKVVKAKLEGTDALELAEDIVWASQSLFECAAVLCREVTGPNQPKSIAARQTFVRSIRQRPGRHRRLHEIYRHVLETHIGTTDSTYLSIYCQFLAWVLAVRQPQPRVVFQEFAHILLDGEKIDRLLVHLGSLLTGTLAGSSDPIRPLHTSFRDFVLDAEASGPFFIKSVFAAADAQLSLACFGIMGRPESGLQYNICNLPSPFVYKRDVENLDNLMTEHMSPGLRYACREVSVHLSRCHDPAGLASALKGFSDNHFLFWLEACGWLGHEPCDVLQDMLEWAKMHDSKVSAPVVSDFISFAKRYREVISWSPPQVYITGLVFAPVDSLVFRLYRPCITSPIEISGLEQEREWPPNETLVIQAEASIYSVALSPDGTKVVSGLLDGTLRLWDAETGRQIGGAMRGHDSTVCSVAFSPDGLRIASGSEDHTVRLWDAKTGQQLGVALHGHTYAVQSVAFSPDSATVVSGSGDCTLRFWDAKTGRAMGGAIKGHTGSVRTVVFSHDGTLIVSAAGDGTVRIWEAATQQQLGDALLGHEDDHVHSVAISSDGKYITSVSADVTIRVWDADKRQLLSASGGHAGWVDVVAFSPNSTYIFSGGYCETVRIWDVASGEQVGDGLVHTVAVVAVGFDTRLDASDDGTVRLWNMATRLPVGDVLQGHDASALCVAFSPDGTRLVSGSADKTLRLWDLATGQQIGDALIGHEGLVRSVSFSSDGLRIASGSDDRSIRLWDAQTRLQRGNALTGHEDYVRSVSFSPNDACVVSGSDDKTVRLWDVKTAQPMSEPLTGHSDWVQSVSFSPDGKYVVSRSDDETVRLWNVQTGKQVGDGLRGHEHLVMSVAFSTDSTRIVSGSWDRTIRIWDFGSLRSSGSASNDAGADLTRARVQASIQDDWYMGLNYDDNGTQRQILWIPHHLRHLHRVTSPHQLGFVPPALYIRVTLTDSFRLDNWPIYTPAPAVKESSENMGPEA
ncbi:quinon protein alcohol dehydrogenase-like superfamily [Schizophyllum commune]